jgi:hypothetical protein
LSKLPAGIGTFEEIRGGGYLYVDKTGYLADMASSGEYYFLSRPRRFGKSLAVSTLDALFSGKKELFRGLRAEGFFDRSDYWACPVVAFDLSGISAECSAEGLENELRHQIAKNAGRHSMEIGASSTESLGVAVGELLQALLSSVGPVVVLIDEYDKPMLNLVQSGEDSSPARRVFRDFFSGISAVMEKLRFVFVTGVTRFSPLGDLSAMNRLEDISMDPRYAAMLGYTDDELSTYFGEYLDEAAASKSIGRDSLITAIKDYYGGYSFDGKSLVYNPFSTLCFFREPEFRNFWFDPGALSFLKGYIKDKMITVEQFCGVDVSRESLAASGEIEHAAAAYFLFQTGSLTLRPGRVHKFTLDYPNREVLVAMSSLFIANILGSSDADESKRRLKKSLLDGNAHGVASEFDLVLRATPYDEYERAARRAIRGLQLDMEADEWLCRSTLLSYMIGMGLEVESSLHMDVKGADMIVGIPGRVWVIGLGFVKGDADADAASEDVVSRMKESGCAAGRGKATLLGLAIGEKSQGISAFKAEDAE